MRLYLDSSAIICGIEGLPHVRTEIIRFLDEAERSDGSVVTSCLSRLECRVKPL